MRIAPRFSAKKKRSFAMPAVCSLSAHASKTTSDRSSAGSNSASPITRAASSCGAGRTSHRRDVNAERFEALSDRRAHRAESDDGPARVSEFAERRALKRFRCLQLALRLDWMQQTECVSDRVLRNRHGLSGALRESNAAQHRLTARRMREAGKQQLHPLQLLRLRHARSKMPAAHRLPAFRNS